MNLKEAMRKRHTVRKYLSRPLEKEIVEKLRSRVDENNEKLNLKIKLVTNDDSIFNMALKIFFAKKANNYFVLASSGEDCEEKLGYAGSDLCLYAQTLGLNTWWVGKTFSKSKLIEKLDGDKMFGIIVVGYGENQGDFHKSKKDYEVSLYLGQEPQWFKDGVKAALLAPTALNKQAFMIKGNQGKVSINYKEGVLSKMDLGIVKHHFELGAGLENFVWDKD